MLQNKISLLQKEQKHPNSKSKHHKYFILIH